MAKSSVLDKVKAYCEEKNISLHKFEQQCGFGNGVMDDWDKNFPRVESLQKLEAVTGIPISEWLS